jgi:hypothetical protein
MFDDCAWDLPTVPETVKIFCSFTSQTATGSRCAVSQEPRYDQRLISALAKTQPKAVAVPVALIGGSNYCQPAEDLSCYVGGHSCNTTISDEPCGAGNILKALARRCFGLRCIGLPIA